MADNKQPNQYVELIKKKNAEYANRKKMYYNQFTCWSCFFMVTVWSTEIISALLSFASGILLWQGISSSISIAFSMIAGGIMVIRSPVKMALMSRAPKQKQELYLKAMECEFKIWQFYVSALSDDDKITKEEYRRFLLLTLDLDKELNDMEFKYSSGGGEPSTRVAPI